MTFVEMTMKWLFHGARPIHFVFAAAVAVMPSAASWYTDKTVLGPASHEFLPIYDENGDLIGFTHPVLVAGWQATQSNT